MILVIGGARYIGSHTVNNKKKAAEIVFVSDSDLLGIGK